MRVLALEPYFGGSHKNFLEAWIKNSGHSWSRLDLPACKWKWRMRHAALTFASQSARMVTDGDNWDVTWASDMLDLCTFKALCPSVISSLPTVLYFHENQYTYPNQVIDPRDLHFGFTNYTSALVADAVWFNSEFHRKSFLSALGKSLRAMPDFQELDNLELIEQKSKTHSPGISWSRPFSCQPKTPTHTSPLKILWAARWEHDKNPAMFFDALRILRRRAVPFRLIMLGQHFRKIPSVISDAREEFSANIEHWGFEPDREKYESLVASSDVFISTANHEFFGISFVESMYAGVVPVIPNRLSYPDLLSEVPTPIRDQLMFNESAPDLADKLCQLAKTDRSSLSVCVKTLAARYVWTRRAREMDAELTNLVEAKKVATSRVALPTKP